MINMEKRIAIIDIGSNTIKLVIYRYKENTSKQIENIKVNARLQNYLDPTNSLTSEGFDVLLETLQAFKEIAFLQKVDTVRVIATAAIRKATNKEEIKNIIRNDIGLTMEILSGDSEAYFLA
jgi:exopolyphosphatase/guanosine-5'-triphosphate,3'-diphosphate pyrophosphatase